ncbi:MAG: ComEC/Rec2 family competence protein [Dehalococcoidales bacterium]|nr:ComEC/Rec2 family competence protein [Dehalococcoidales bacterium]
MVLIYLSCAWVAGVFLGYKLNVPPLLCLAGLAPLLLLVFTRRYLKTVVLACLGIIIFVAAAAYSYHSLYAIDDGRVHFYNDLGTVEITGIVSGDPDVRDSNTRLHLSTSAIRLESGWHDIEGMVLVFVPRYPAYEYGDVLQVTGELATPPQLDDFDYQNYLAHQGIHATLYYPKIEVLDTGRGFAPLAWIYSLRGKLAENLAQALPEPQASLAQGVVLGIRGNIPQDLRDDFSRSGTAHLLAISGLHLGIMAGIMLGIGIWLFGRRYYLYVWLALAAVWLYTIITGMNPSVVRGAIMASLFLIAEALGRQRSAMVALTFAAAVMVGVHPYILGDASFQLSFLAMVGLVFIFPVIREWGRGLISRWLGEEGALVATVNVIVDTWSATLGAVIAIWPVVAYYFGIISLAGPLATFLALPALPCIIIFGGLAALVGLALTAAAQIIGWLAWLFLSYMIAVIGGIGSSPLSSVGVASIHPAVIWGYYLVLAAAIGWHGYRKRLRGVLAGTAGRMRAGIIISFGLSGLGKWLILPLLVAAVLVVITAATMPDDDLRISFLDVGEGDAILIQRGGRQVLVDGGPSPREITLGLGSRMPFWDRTIDLVVMTHPHQDHLAGLVEVLRRYRVERALYPDLGYQSPLYDEWQRLIDEKEIKSIAAKAGQVIDLGDGVFLKVLSPLPALFAGSESDVDNNSVVLRLVAGDVSFLLTGDIMDEAERELVRGRAGLAATVLKVGHHGSDTSTTPGFLSVVSPQAAVICCGTDNRHGHPDAGVIQRLEGEIASEYIYRTDIHGTVDFFTDGERLWVKD